MASCPSLENETTGLQVATLKQLLIVLGSLLIVPGWSYELSAQTIIQFSDGKSIQAVPSTPGKRPSKPPAAKKGAKPPTPSKSDAAKGKKDAAKKADEAPKTTQRPTKPDVPPDPKELELRPSEDGKMKLSFKGQPWPHLLEWLAKVSNMSLDWQELPADYLNLVTDRRYTVEEVQDLINQSLLSRGFTMLRNGEVLSVVNIKKLDPSMVPRVSPEELAQRNPHEFVRVSFRLDWLLAEQAVTEFEPMRSPNGKLTPLKETNRLEAMDAVINLREIYRLITEEQAGDSQKQLVREFKLKHTRASKVLEQLQTLLGIEKSSKAAGPLTPQQIQAQQRAAMMVRSQPGNKAKTTPSKPKAEVHLVVNVRENSILANAPPDKMAIVAQAIEIIDVPADASKSLLRNLDRMQVYRLAALDPETLVKILEDVGSLDYDTKLEVDTKSKAVIAYASLADHLMIQSVVDRLDGSGRSFHVLPLRRLESDYVAGTIRLMMGGQEEKKKQSTSRFYGFYDPYGSRNKQEDSSDKFRVEGDVEFNRLLLWANDVELREVENLLIKLGEIPSRGGNSNTMRVIDVEPGEDTEELLKRLRRIWPSLGPNELLLDPPAESKGTDKEKEEKRTQDAKPQVKPNLLKSTQSSERSSPQQNPESRLIIPVALNDGSGKDVEVAGDSAETAQQTQPRIVNEEGNLINPNFRNSNLLRNRRQTPGITPPPISITRTSDGRLMISSQDTRALDRLEEVMTQMIPPRKDYRIFNIKYADAYWVMQNLKEYFEEDDKNTSMNSYNPFNYYGYPSSETSSAPRRLSRRKPLKFIYDLDTNTILAQGGDPQQLKTVEDLIKLYDLPRNTDTKMLRQTKLVSLEYAKAKIVASAIKDVYRDLLSANDKALINGQQKPKTESRYSTTYIFGDGEQSGQKIPKYKGALSVGVDETSNTLVISAQPYLLSEVTEMVNSLDEAAKPFTSAMRVVEIRYADAFRLQKSLSGVLSRKPSSGQSAEKSKKPAQTGLKPGQTIQTTIISP